MSVQSTSIKRLLKRRARRLFVSGCRLFGKCHQGQLPYGLRILTYHRIEADPLDPFAVSPQDFSQQMQILKEANVCRSLSGALDKLHSGDGGKTMIALTFDDGTEDFIYNAIPVLQRLGLPATLYVSPALVGTQGYLDWEQTKELLNYGIDIGSHGMTHESMGQMALDDAWKQIAESRRIIEGHLEVKANSLSYPFGTVRDFNHDVKKLVKEAGYRYACSSINGLNNEKFDPLELRRTKIEQADGPIFNSILSGCLDGWSFIDTHLSGLQNRYVRSKK